MVNRRVVEKERKVVEMARGKGMLLTVVASRYHLLGIITDGCFDTQNSHNVTIESQHMRIDTTGKTLNERRRMFEVFGGVFEEMRDGMHSQKPGWPSRRLQPFCAPAVFHSA